MVIVLALVACRAIGGPVAGVACPSPLPAQTIAVPQTVLAPQTVLVPQTVVVTVVATVRIVARETVLVVVTATPAPRTATATHASLTPTVRGTLTGTPTPSSTVAAMARSARLGQSVEEAGISLTAVAIDDPAQLAPSQSYEVPKGDRLVAVKVAVGDISADEVTINALRFTLIDSDGLDYLPEPVTLVQGSFPMVSLDPGEQVQGWIAFAIPQRAVPAAIEYDITVTGPSLQAGLR